MTARSRASPRPPATSIVDDFTQEDIKGNIEHPPPPSTENISSKQEKREVADVELATDYSQYCKSVTIDPLVESPAASSFTKENEAMPTDKACELAQDQEPISAVNYITHANKDSSHPAEETELTQSRASRHFAGIVNPSDSMGKSIGPVPSQPPSLEYWEEKEKAPSELWLEGTSGLSVLPDELHALLADSEGRVAKQIAMSEARIAKKFEIQSKEMTNRLALLEEGGRSSRRSTVEEFHDDSSEDIVEDKKDDLRARRNCARSSRQSMYIEYIKENVLQESTFSLFITENMFSVPYLFALLTTSMSVLCLALALISAFEHGTTGNPFGLPVDVSVSVCIAQFLGLFIGVLMGEEVPAGLELIALGACQTLLLDRKVMVRKRIVFYSFLRLGVGYMFLLSLFFLTAQNKTVLDVFFDVLEALQFVEKIDDNAYALAKRGFFGQRLLNATHENHTVERVGLRTGVESAKRVSIFIRIIYYLNALALVCGLIVIIHQQSEGNFRCRSITISFGEDFWADGIVKNPNGDGIDTERRLLLYSFFSGVYAETDTFNGYPRYVEQNKNEGTPFISTKGAEFKFCKEIKSWVFAHSDIKTSPNEEDENECSWLMRSPPTHDYDIRKVANYKWTIWKGQAESNAVISATCNECFDRSECNYGGQCTDKKCFCDEEHFGDRCEFRMPCTDLASNMGMHETLRLSKVDVSARTFQMAYSRPIYSMGDLTGNQVALLHGDPDPTVSDETPIFGDHGGMPDNMTIFYSGSRWYGSLLDPNTFGQDFHSFWNNALSGESTLIVSEVTDVELPIEPLEWFTLSSHFGARKRPYGSLNPMISTSGEEGLLQCAVEWSGKSSG
ncbi:hypothetical protein ACHAWF_011289 [Thalassiosira exigua]